MRTSVPVRGCEIRSRSEDSDSRADVENSHQRKVCNPISKGIANYEHSCTQWRRESLTVGLSSLKSLLSWSDSCTKLLLLLVIRCKNNTLISNSHCRLIHWVQVVSALNTTGRVRAVLHIDDNTNRSWITVAASEVKAYGHAGRFAMLVCMAISMLLVFWSVTLSMITYN